MRKKLIIILSLVAGLVLALGIGIYVYNKGSISDTNIISDKRLAELNQNQETIEKSEEDANTVENEVIPTSIVSTNISPNAIIIEKKYYKDCDHLIREVKDIPEELINKTEEDIKKNYKGWKLEGYSPSEIVFSRDFDRFL